MALKKLAAYTRKGHTAAESKKRLVEAGLELFARNGFDGVSTRTLANLAQVNLAAIQYYFGGKEGLYLAVARHIAETIRGWNQPVLSRIENTLSADRPGREASFMLLCELLDHIMQRALSSQESTKWLGIFMREQIEPTDAFDILYEGVMEPFHLCLSALIARVLNIAPEDSETKLRAYAISGQVFIFHLSRAEIRRSMAWTEFRPRELELIRRVILEQVRAIMDIPRENLDSYFCSAGL
jgi:TetR/AcrR family transcriptional regulator, regulator of cefoperazone and chloramphenicol sensitivity